MAQGRSGVLRTFCLWVLTKGHAKSCSGYCQSPRMAVRQSKINYKNDMEFCFALQPFLPTHMPRLLQQPARALLSCPLYSTRLIFLLVPLRSTDERR
jgi:hypothetical protein